MHDAFFNLLLHCRIETDFLGEGPSGSSSKGTSGSSKLTSSSSKGTSGSSDKLRESEKADTVEDGQSDSDSDSISASWSEAGLTCLVPGCGAYEREFATQQYYKRHIRYESSNFISTKQLV